VGVFFLRTFGPLYLENSSRYQNVPSKYIIENLKIYKFDSIHFFDIWNGFWDISKKLFLKKLFQMLRFPKTSWLGPNYVVFFRFSSSFIAGNQVSSGQHSRGNVSAKLGVGVFLDISNPCISKTVGHIKTNMEVLGRLRPHFLRYRYEKPNQWRALDETFSLTWLLIGLSLKITTLGSPSVSPSYPKQVYLKQGLVHLFCRWSL